MQAPATTQTAAAEDKDFIQWVLSRWWDTT
jgi:hypothetical protein